MSPQHRDNATGNVSSNPRAGRTRAQLGERRLTSEQGIRCGHIQGAHPTRIRTPVVWIAADGDRWKHDFPLDAGVSGPAWRNITCRRGSSVPPDSFGTMLNKMCLGTRGNHFDSSITSEPDKAIFLGDTSLPRMSRDPVMTQTLRQRRTVRGTLETGPRRNHERDSPVRGRREHPLPAGVADGPLEWGCWNV